MRNYIRILFAAFLPAMAVAQVREGATSSNAPKLPDIAGIRTGISIQEAASLLKAHNPKWKLAGGEDLIAELGSKPLLHTLQVSESGDLSPDILQVRVALPPNPQVVWKVGRQLTFREGNEMLNTKLMEALREKYGPELSFAGNRQTPFWFFDQQGKRAPDAALTHCSMPIADPSATIGLDLYPGPYLRPLFAAQVPAEQRFCLSLIRVRAVLGSAGANDISRQMEISITDIGLMVRAKEATYGQIMKVQQDLGNKELERLQKQSVPKL